MCIRDSNVISYAGKTADLIAAKTAYQDDIAAGRTSDWTHLKGEAEALRALCYFDLIKHCGDVPYGYENNYVDDYGLTSRFDIYDALIEKLKAAEPYMYKVCLLYTSPSPRDRQKSRMPSSA